MSMPERCSVIGCENQPDPRFGAHRREDGAIVMICDACFIECPAGDPSACLCKPTYPPIT